FFVDACFSLLVLRIQPDRLPTGQHRRSVMAGEKTAIVTGAGTGIGKASAVALLKSGWNTVFAGRRQDVLDEAVKSAGKTEAKALAIAADVSQPADVDRLFDRAVAELGRVDLLFNNAGRGFKTTLIDELPVEV